MKRIIFCLVMAFSMSAAASDYVRQGAVVDFDVDLNRVLFFQLNTEARLDHTCSTPWYEQNKDIDRDGDFVSKAGVELCYDPCDYYGANGGLVSGPCNGSTWCERPVVSRCE